MKSQIESLNWYFLDSQKQQLTVNLGYNQHWLTDNQSSLNLPKRFDVARPLIDSKLKSLSGQRIFVSTLNLKDN